MFNTVVAPFARYHHADVLHSLRLGVSVVLAMLFNYLTDIGHGEWTMITVFIVLGLLQYQGAIFTKAKERILGTIYGIIIGFALHYWHYHGLSELPWLYFAIIGIISTAIGYFTIKNLGYVGLLTGITMSMIIGDPNAGVDEGVMRAVNVLAGTLIVLFATIIMPLKSTLMWRFLLADNLEACRKVYAGVFAHIEKTQPVNEGDWQRTSEFIPDTLLPEDIPANSRLRPFETPLTKPVGDELRVALQAINTRLLQVRKHIDATVRETGIDKATLEEIQHTHRNLIGTIDLLLTRAPKLATLPISHDNRELLVHYQNALNQAMQTMANVLRSPTDETFRPITRIQVSEYPSISELSFDWQGYFWLTQTLQAQLQHLSDLLSITQTKWFVASGRGYQKAVGKTAKKSLTGKSEAES